MMFFSYYYLKFNYPQFVYFNKNYNYFMQRFRQKLLSHNLPILSHPLRQKAFDKDDKQSSIQLKLKKCESTPDEHKNSFEDKYQIQGYIGQGSHGIVKYCRLKGNGYIYAVKIMRIDEESALMNKQNFRTMKCLSHQNIIKYKALYLNNKQRKCYLIMECFNYPSLKSYQTNNQQQLKHIVTQILLALIYMHKKKICHRDLKTQNILYDSKLKKLKLVDFGICKKLSKRQQRVQMMTPTGTFLYKAPQMFTGEQYDQKVDLWALGIIIYQLVTKKHPFLSNNQEDQAVDQFKIINKELTFEQQCWKNYSKLCKDLIWRLLKKNKQQRLNSEQAAIHPFFQNHFNQCIKNSQRIKKKTQKNIVQQNIQTLLVKKISTSEEDNCCDKQQKNNLMIQFFDSQQEGGIVDD